MAWFRKLPIDDPRVAEEFTEILATVKEERESKGTRHECLKRGNWIRFAIAWSMFTLQQWSGQVCIVSFALLCYCDYLSFIFRQNSIGYYAPEIFHSIGIGDTNVSLFASGIYGLVKVVATTIFLFFGIEQFGRKRSLIGGFELFSKSSLD